MNKKGEVGVGMIVLVAVTLIVGVILFTAIAQEVGTATSTVTLANQSGNSLATAGNSIYLTDYRSLSSVVIYNATGTLVPAANYTVTNNVIDPTTGGLSVQITTGAVSEHAGDAVNISGTAQPVTYIADGGARAVALLISIFFALAVAIVALEPTLRSGVLQMMGR